MLKVKDGVPLTNGQFVKIDSNGEIISAVPTDTTYDADQVVRWGDAGTGTIDTSNLSTGKDNTKLLQCSADLSHDDYLKIGSSGTGVIGKTTTEVKNDLGIILGKDANNLLQVAPDKSGNPSVTAGEVLRMGTDGGVDAGKVVSTPQVVLGDLITDAVNQQGGLFLKKMMLASSSSNSHNGVVPLYIPYGNSPNITDDNSTFRQFFATTGKYLKQGSDPTGSAHQGAQNCSIYALKNIICGTRIVSMTSPFNGSDDRIKSEETPIENATETLLKITGKNYFKHPSYRVDEQDESPIPEKDASGNVIRKEWESGVIAQEVLGVSELSHLVNESIDPITSEDTLIMNYTGLIPFLIKSNQELHERIKSLDERILELEK